MVQRTDPYHVIVLGAGLSGTVLASILARHGQRVLVLEASRHPKFAIGESLILEASEMFRMLAESFSVPEIAHFSAENCFPVIGTSHGVKKHFGFLYHRAGEEQRPHESLQVIIPAFPYSHELHIHRQDCDYYYLSVAVRYGATVLQDTRVTDVRFEREEVRVATDRGEFAARYVADASGHRSVVAAKLGLRRYGLETRSRSVFTHMVGVPGYHEVARPRRHYGVPYPWTEGSLHHVFDGGWFWVIPFGNHPTATNPLCSVGLTVDPRVWPKREDLSPDEEFRSFLDRYPAVAAQLRHGRPVRDWVRTDRIQYSSERVVGDRFCLLGHTAGFVDPLFSKGIYVSLSCVFVAARLLLRAGETGDHSAEAFRPLEELTRRFLSENDALVANAYRSWCDAELWHAYSVVWLLGAYLELVKITVARMKMQRALAEGSATASSLGPEYTPGTLQGGGYGEYETLAARVHAVVRGTDPGDPDSVRRSVEELRRLYAEAEWMPHQYTQIARGKNHTPRRKFTHRILLKPGGVLGNGTFRRHFFEDLGAWSIGSFLLKERIRYSRRRFARRRARGAAS